MKSVFMLPPSLPYINQTVLTAYLINLFMSARVIGPKYPIAGLMPYAFWNRMSACWVNPPNLVVSFPFDPAPFVEMVNPWSFKNFCNSFMSFPVTFKDASEVNELMARSVT